MEKLVLKECMLDSIVFETLLTLVLEMLYWRALMMTSVIKPPKDISVITFSLYQVTFLIIFGDIESK